MAFDSVYRLLEDRFRGDQELITQRLQIYAPLLQEISAQRQQAKASDLGCGRGEWLSICKSHDLICTGVDQNAGMLAACRDQGLSVVQDDIFAYLAELRTESQVLISAFHVIEHLDQVQIQLLIRESHRALAPGGILILETPNYANIHVGTCSFYLDPTHQTPINPQLIKLFMEDEGFSFSVHAFLQGIRKDSEPSQIGIYDVLYKAAYDLALLAIKGEQIISSQFIDSWSKQVSCMSTAALAEAYDIRLNQAIILLNQLSTRIEQLERARPSAKLVNLFRKLMKCNQK